MAMSYRHPRSHVHTPPVVRQEPLLCVYCSRLSWHLGSFHYYSNRQVLHFISTRPQTLHPAPPSIHQPAAQLLLCPLPRPLRGSALLTSAAVQNGGVVQWLAVSSTDWTTLAGHWSWASQLSPQSPSPYLVKFENGLLRMELTSTGDSILRRPCSGVLTSPNLPPTEFSRIS